jgi:Uma2 family endonuclease
MSAARSRPRHECLAGVTYDEYLRLRDDPDHAGRRMAYHDGVLEIMSPEFRHEKGGRRLGAVVMAYCKAFGLAGEAAGHTTFRKGTPGQEKGAGNEADECFYVGGDAEAILDQETLDLAVDSPPSLWLEVDSTASSVPREPLHAQLGVPEVWRYRVRDRPVSFRRLAGGAYEDAASSAALPGMTPALVLDALAGTRDRSLVAYSRWLDEVWFPAHRQELEDAGADR